MKAEIKEIIKKDKTKIIAEGKKLQRREEKELKALLKTYNTKEPVFLDEDLQLYKMMLAGETKLLRGDILDEDASEQMKEFVKEWKDIYETSIDTFMEDLGYELVDTDPYDGQKEFRKKHKRKDGTEESWVLSVGILPVHDKHVKLLKE